jgi:hypothetical protein
LDSNDLRQAITVIDFSELGGKRAAMPKIDWSNYDGSTLVVNYDARVKKWQKHEISPCPNNMPIGYSLTGDCALSGVVVHDFRPEMCIGTIADNGDCHTVGQVGRWALQPNCALMV